MAFYKIWVEWLHVLLFGHIETARKPEMTYHIDNTTVYLQPTKSFASSETLLQVLPRMDTSFLPVSNEDTSYSQSQGTQRKE